MQSDSWLEAWTCTTYIPYIYYLSLPLSLHQSEHLSTQPDVPGAAIHDPMHFRHAVHLEARNGWKENHRYLKARYEDHNVALINRSRTHTTILCGRETASNLTLMMRPRALHTAESPPYRV